MIPKIIYIHKGPESYFKLCDDSTGGRNVYGLIEKDGTLCGKARLGYFKKSDNYTLSSKGASRSCGGTGYDGWVKFDNVDAAVEFLEKYYTVVGCNRNNVRAIFESRGLIQMSLDEQLPHDGLDGVLFRNPNNIKHVPIYNVPRFPTGGDREQERRLIEDCFKQITDILTESKNRHGSVEVAFLGHYIEIPKWFREWCEQQTISIMNIQPHAEP